MARLTLAIVLLAAFPALAQQAMYRCVDQNNRVSFSDKPGPGCKMTQKPAAEQPAASGKGAGKGAQKSAQAKAAKVPAETPAQRCARIRGQFSDMRGADREKARALLDAEC